MATEGSAPQSSADAPAEVKATPARESVGASPQAKQPAAQPTESSQPAAPLQPSQPSRASGASSPRGSTAAWQLGGTSPRGINRLATLPLDATSQPSLPTTPRRRGSGSSVRSYSAQARFSGGINARLSGTVLGPEPEVDRRSSNASGVIRMGRISTMQPQSVEQQSARRSESDAGSGFFDTGATSQAVMRNAAATSQREPSAARAAFLASLKEKKALSNRPELIEMAPGESSPDAGFLAGRLKTTVSMANYVSLEATQRAALEEQGEFPLKYVPLRPTSTMQEYVRTQRKRGQTRGHSTGDGDVGKRKTYGKRMYGHHPCQASTVDRVVFGRLADYNALRLTEDEYKNGYKRMFVGDAGKQAYAAFNRRGLKRQEKDSREYKKLNLSHDNNAPVENPFRGDEYAPLTQHSEVGHQIQAEPALDFNASDLKFPPYFRDRFSGAAGRPSWYETTRLLKSPSEETLSARKSTAGAQLGGERAEGMRMFPDNPNTRAQAKDIVNGITLPHDPEQYYKIYRGAAGRGSWEFCIDHHLHTLPNNQRRYGQRTGLKTTPKTPAQLSRMLEAAFGRKEVFEQDAVLHERVAAELYEGCAGRASWHHTSWLKARASHGGRPPSATQPIDLSHNGHLTQRALVEQPDRSPQRATSEERHRSYSVPSGQRRSSSRERGHG